ncbi:MAG TPA: MarR family transcriptional regulator [Bacteroidia bacterium]|jgi:DNA-binding MarR family transcriptional regulator|nr:MarR family transcriptional regulator [Bacteroidia bacterium]
MAKKETYCSRVKQSWHAISRMYNTEAITHDLTTTIGFILLQIDSKEGIPSTKIGPAIGMEATSLVRTLNQMEEKGLITRRKDKSDARKVMIQLTAKGKQKRDVSKKAVESFNQMVEKTIGTAKLKIFNEVIEEINQIAEKLK